MPSAKQILKISFSGHDSFQCRQLWLKKGYDFVKSGGDFAAEDAVLQLGVGKNMVTAIRHWLKVFGIVENEATTDFGDLIFDDETGLDPFLEDYGTLWLLHYNLVTLGLATTYNWLFTDFRIRKMEFSREDFVKYVRNRCEEEGLTTPNANTVADDFDVLKKMYFSGKGEYSNPEEEYAGILCELLLLSSIGKGKNEVYLVESGEQRQLPWQVVLYTILENSSFAGSINMNSLLYDTNSPGIVFALSKAGLIDKVEAAAKRHRSIVYTDQAGIKEIQVKKGINSKKILEEYYGK